MSSNGMQSSDTLLFNITIPHINIKCFQHIINFLLKVDSEIILEVTSTGMWLRSLNDAKSAFVCVELNPNAFFSQFDVKVESNSDSNGNKKASGTSDNEDSNLNSDNNAHPNKRRKENKENVLYTCKIYGKSILNVFRSPLLSQTSSNSKHNKAIPQKQYSLCIRNSSSTTRYGSSSNANGSATDGSVISSQILECNQDPSLRDEIIFEIIQSRTHVSSQIGDSSPSCQSYLQRRCIHRYNTIPNMDIMNAVFEYPLLNTMVASAKLLHKSINYLYNAHEILLQFNGGSGSASGSTPTPTYNSGNIRLKTLHENVDVNADPTGQSGGCMGLGAQFQGANMNGDGNMNTELVISANDFNVYTMEFNEMEHIESMCIAMCIKEFRAMLNLCDTVQGSGAGCGGVSIDTTNYGQSAPKLDGIGTDVVIQFTTGGAPLRMYYQHAAPLVDEMNLSRVTQTQISQSLSANTVPLFNASLIIATLNINSM